MKYAPEDAERVLRKMFSKLDEAGWKIVQVFDGQDSYRVSTVEAALDIIDSVEDSTVSVEKEGVRGHGIYLIPSNGADVICDHSLSEGDADDFEALMTSIISED